MSLALVGEAGRGGVEAEGAHQRATVELREPGQRDEGEQGMPHGRARPRREAQFLGQRVHRLGPDGLREGEVAGAGALAEGVSLDQPHEDGMGGHEVHVVAHGACEHLCRWAPAAKGAGPTGADGVERVGEAVLQHGGVEPGLGAEEIRGGGARDTGGLANLCQRDGIEAAGREELTGRIEDGGAGALGVAGLDRKSVV